MQKTDIYTFPPGQYALVPKIFLLSGSTCRNRIGTAAGFNNLHRFLYNVTDCFPAISAMPALQKEMQSAAGQYLLLCGQIPGQSR